MNILLGRARLGTGPQPKLGTGPQPKLGTGPQPKEMDEINPESPCTDLAPVSWMASVAHIAPVPSAPAERGAAAADREHQA